jgi:hypothetical protein
MAESTGADDLLQPHTLTIDVRAVATATAVSAIPASGEVGRLCHGG